MALFFSNRHHQLRVARLLSFMAKRLEFYVLILEFLSYILNFLRIIFSKVSSPLHVFATDLLSIKIEDLLYLLNSGAALAFQVDLFARIDSIDQKLQSM